MECLKRVCTHSGKYMLDIFLEICREDYVGDGDASSKRKLVHEICKQLSLIKMKNGDTLDKMYARYISMVAGFIRKSRKSDTTYMFSTEHCVEYYSFQLRYFCAAASTLAYIIQYALY